MAMQLYCWQQASLWKRRVVAVRPLPAPQAPQALLYQSDTRLDRGDRASDAGAPERGGSEATGTAEAGTAGLAGEIASDSRLSVAVVPSDVTTYVYLNGGSLLGRAPLRDLPVRPGQHRLILWAPSIRGRAVRTVTVAPGEHATIMTVLAAVPTAAGSMVR